MAISTLVGNPEKMTLSEVEDTLKKIKLYKEEYTPNSVEAGVLLNQNRQLGAIYEITSKEEAKRAINTPVSSYPRTCEWGIKFYPQSFFEERRKNLRKSK